MFVLLTPRAYVYASAYELVKASLNRRNKHLKSAPVKVKFILFFIFLIQIEFNEKNGVPKTYSVVFSLHA